MEKKQPARKQAIQPQMPDTPVIKLDLKGTGMTAGDLASMLLPGMKYLGMKEKEQNPQQQVEECSKQKEKEVDMTDQYKRFENIILRPLQIIIFLLSAIIFLVKGMWWWLAGGIVALFYLGIIGSKLHPLQSSSNLAEGPTTNPGSQIESELLPQEVKQMLVGHACTRVGILIGVFAGIASWAFLAWHWYFAFLFALLAMLFSGAILKLLFKTIQVSE